MDILYYSNHCKHSQNILRNLAKTSIREKACFICIDKRTRDQKNNQVYILLENGTKVIMPPNIHSVPALLLVKQNYRVIYGDEIMKHFQPHIMKDNDLATQRNGEPMAFQLSGSSGGTNIVSEAYTLYNMSPDELSAKGKGGMRQLYNYVPVSDETTFIQTPPDTYRPDKLSNSVTIDTLQQQRNEEISKIASKGPSIQYN
jgi:hypothetical protein